MLRTGKRSKPTSGGPGEPTADLSGGRSGRHRFGVKGGRGEPTEQPPNSPSSWSPKTRDPSSPSDRPARSRDHIVFWTLSSVVILALGAANVSWWVPEALREAHRKELEGRRKKLQNLWPTVSRVLEHSPSIEVIALNPNGVEHEVKTFHDFGVLGRATIRDPGEIKALVAAFQEGRREGGQAYLCFDPRHGIHVRDGDKDLDLVICFECEQGYLYFGDIDGRWFGISKSPRPSFDEIFKKAGLQIAK
jgi:hypothetical protein